MRNLSAGTREIVNKQRGMLNNFSLLLIFPSGKETAVAGKSLRTFNVMRQLNLCWFSSCIALADVCVRNRRRVCTQSHTCPCLHLSVGYLGSPQPLLRSNISIVGPVTFKWLLNKSLHQPPTIGSFNELFSSSVCRASPSSLLIADGNGDFH